MTKVRVGVRFGAEVLHWGGGKRPVFDLRVSLWTAFTAPPPRLSVSVRLRVSHSSSCFAADDTELLLLTARRRRRRIFCAASSKPVSR